MRERLADQQELLRQRAIARKAKEAEELERQESVNQWQKAKEHITSRTGYRRQTTSGRTRSQTTFFLFTK